MSSFTRTIQRTVERAKKVWCRAPHFTGRGSKLGVSNPKDAALLARRSREKKRKQAHG